MSFTLHDTVAPSTLTGGRTEAALAGTTIAGRYEVLDLVAVGGMGAVYRARDRELDEIVALKVIRRELAALPEMVERFRHEVKLARRVTHVNVARTFELGTSDGLMFCTMELVEGESLAKRIAQRGAMPVGEAVAIACAVCEGLAAAHAAGVIHRDIKPDNVLLAHDGRVVVADFGVAAAGVEAAGELSGTPAYMAPEQARGEPAISASDVYAVGIVIYEMVTGKHPFTGTMAEVLAAKQSTERIQPSLHSVPVALATVIGEATARDVDTRIASARALRQAIETWAAPLGRSSRPVLISPTPAHDIATVIVLSPRGESTDPRLYLTTAVHEQLLSRLATRRRLRVLPRTTETREQGPFTVSFELETQLVVTVTLETGLPIVLRFPLAVEQVHATADAIAATIDAALARSHYHDERADEAFDLLLQARHIAYRDFTRMPETIDGLERAHQLAPQDARISATLATAYVRTGFFLPDLYPQGFERARLLATAAVTTAPDLADAHIACGHFGLMSGNPELAASHFRIAIARAPHFAEAHEQLGRMLLEAGYIDEAVARLNEALAIMPTMRSAYWEIARAAALDANWDENERIITELVTSGLDRPLSRARYAWWRSDWATVAALRTKISNLDRVLWPGVVDVLFEVFLDKRDWASCDQVFEGLRRDTQNSRRRVFVAQLCCEAAAFAGAADSVVALLECAAEDGLFDLHWLDRCVMLAPYRHLPGFMAVRSRIADRAHAILDALYGDHAAALSATQVA